MNIRWRGEDVGSYVIESVDMWYLDGLFIPNNTHMAKEFSDLVKSLKYEEVFLNHNLGILVELSDDKGLTKALILGYFGETLGIRII